MKRMKKKVVAMVTLAMFVMTLLPMAAFAAPTSDPAVASKSSVTVAEDNEVVDVNEAVALDVEILDANGYETSAQLGKVKLWATKGDVVVDTETWYGDAAGSSDIADADWKVQGTVVNGSLVNDQKVFVKFAEAGEYTIHAAVVNDDKTETPFAEGQQIVNVNTVDQKEITFTAPSSVTANFNNSDAQKEKVFTITSLGKDYHWNTIDNVTITGKLTNEKGQAMNGVDINLSSNKNVLSLEDDVVTTKANGEFEITFDMVAKANAAITVDAGELVYTIKVMVADTSANDISVVKDGGIVLATTDTTNWKNAADSKFVDAVQFEITDKNGNPVNNATGHAFDTTNATEHARCLEINEKGYGSTIKPANLKLVWNSDKEVYTFELVNATKKTLTPGDYKVTVSLDNDQYATATFTAAEFSEVKDLVVDMSAKKTGEVDGYVDVTDKVALGDDLKVVASYVDENGLKIPADKVAVSVTGKAIEKAYSESQFKNIFQIAPYSVTNEALIGSLIDVVVVDNTGDYEGINKVVKNQLTVVDPWTTYSIDFESEEGKVNKDNTVDYTVVDENGDRANEVTGDVKFFIADQSNKDAKVTVDGSDNVNQGKGSLEIYSDEATTVDVTVVVYKQTKAVAVGTLTYAMGEEDIPAGTSVVMTLGSTEMIINNEVVDMKDAAPFAQDNRTYVPFRALGEALGADVEYDKDAKTVTYELGSTKIVMTLDSKDYTVNGAKKTMDVAPFAKDNRTYVPVRFVGEGLGFTVTGLTNANGQYVAVAFTK